MICAGIADEHSMTTEEARKLVWMCDSRGLVTTTRDSGLEEHKIPYARDEEPAAELLEVVKRVKPTILIGASGHAHTFTEDVVKTMHKHCEQPIIFALSNPTTKAECTLRKPITGPMGAIFASGSPFTAVRLNGKCLFPARETTCSSSRAWVLGAVVCGASKVTDEMFFTQPRPWPTWSPRKSSDAGTIYPDLGKSARFHWRSRLRSAGWPGTRDWPSTPNRRTSGNTYVIACITRNTGRTSQPEIVLY